MDRKRVCRKDRQRRQKDHDGHEKGIGAVLVDHFEVDGQR
jgi:hypothetical protein